MLINCKLCFFAIQLFLIISLLYCLSFKMALSLLTNSLDKSFFKYKFHNMASQTTVVKNLKF